MNKTIKLIACLACVVAFFTSSTIVSATLWGFSAGVWCAQFFLE